MPDLPFVDEIARDVDAPPADTFAALEEFAATSPSPRSLRLARVLGCRPPEIFAVSERAAPERLTLDGEHRFARYRLAFVVEPGPRGGSRLRALTYAAFPGPRGRAYRLAVLGSRGHVIVVRRLLDRLGRRAASRAHGRMPGPQRNTEA